MNVLSRAPITMSTPTNKRAAIQEVLLEWRKLWSGLYATLRPGKQLPIKEPRSHEPRLRSTPPVGIGKGRNNPDIVDPDTFLSPATPISW